MRRLFRLTGREPDLADDVRAELEGHVALKIDALVRQGLDRAAAEIEARRQFGVPVAIEGATRAAAAAAQRRRRWRGRAGAWAMDWRLGIRGLIRSPLYSLTAIGILALGIGASLAVLAIADRIFWRPFPFADPDRLMVLIESHPDGSLRTPSYPTVRDWQTQAASFESIAYVPGTQVAWRRPTGVETITTAFPSAEFFGLMGTPALVGRTLTAGDEAEGTRVAVLSHSLWQRRFGSDPNVVGTSFPLSDGVVTIVGVMPLGFRFPEWADLYLPITVLPPATQAAVKLRGNHADGYTVGRLRAGDTRAGAEAAMKVIAARLAQEYPNEQAGWTSVTAIPISSFIVQFGNRGLTNPTTTVAIFAGAVALVLLIACANVAGLTLVRGQTRIREVVIRTAIGASRRQVLRHLLIESGLLAAGGAVLGIGLALGLLALLKHQAPEILPRLAEVQLDPRLILLAVGLGAASAILSGLGPALRITARPPGSLLRSVGLQSTNSAAAVRFQRALVVGQLALAVTLLIGAAVLIKSFVRVVATDVGFDSGGLVAVTITPPETNRTKAGAIELYRRLAEAVGRVPGVRAVALTNHVPIGGASLPTRLEVAGFVPPSEQAEPSANFRSISPEYFVAMGIPVLLGTGFTDADLAAPNDKLVVNQSLARRYWPNDNPLGKRITIHKSARWLPDFGEPISGLVIGVVGDVRHFGAETTPPDEVYLPYTWNPWAWTGMVVRASGDPRRLIDPIWQAISTVDPDLPRASGAGAAVVSFDDRMAESRRPRRLMTATATAMALVAVLLAVAGLYGVMAYLVGIRRREIAIRGALGATRTEVVTMVMRQGLAMGVTGTAIGVAVGLAGASLLQRLTFAVSARDLTAFTVVPLGLLAAAALAVYFPARRASSLDPAQVLKDE